MELVCCRIKEDIQKHCCPKKFLLDNTKEGYFMCDEYYNFQGEYCCIYQYLFMKYKALLYDSDKEENIDSANNRKKRTNINTKTKKSKENNQSDKPIEQQSKILTVHELSHLLLKIDEHKEKIKLANLYYMIGFLMKNKMEKMTQNPNVVYKPELKSISQYNRQYVWISCMMSYNDSIKTCVHKNCINCALVYKKVDLDENGKPIEDPNKETVYQPLTDDELIKLITENDNNDDDDDDDDKIQIDKEYDRKKTKETIYEKQQQQEEIKNQPVLSDQFDQTYFLGCDWSIISQMEIYMTEERLVYELSMIQSDYSWQRNILHTNSIYPIFYVQPYITVDVTMEEFDFFNQLRLNYEFNELYVITEKVQKILTPSENDINGSCCKDDPYGSILNSIITKKKEKPKIINPIENKKANNKNKNNNNNNNNRDKRNKKKIHPTTFTATTITTTTNIEDFLNSIFRSLIRTHDVINKNNNTCISQTPIFAVFLKIIHFMEPEVFHDINRRVHDQKKFFIADFLLNNKITINKKHHQTIFNSMEKQFPDLPKEKIEKLLNQEKLLRIQELFMYTFVSVESTVSKTSTFFINNPQSFKVLRKNLTLNCPHLD